MFLAEGHLQLEIVWKKKKTHKQRGTIYNLNSNSFLLLLWETFYKWGPLCVQGSYPTFCAASHRRPHTEVLPSARSVHEWCLQHCSQPLDWTIQPGFQMGSSDAEWKTDDRSSPGISESVKSVLLGGRRKPQDVIRSEGTDLSERCSPLWRKVWPVRLESWVWKLVLHLSGCGALDG